MWNAKRSRTLCCGVVAALALLLATGSAWSGQRRPRTRPGARGVQRRRVPRFEDKLKPGDLAPDFELKSLDGKQTVRLSSFRGKKPVLLIFGSYT